MKFYVTVENINKLKRCFLNLKIFSIINIPEILEEFGYTYDNLDQYKAFIVEKKIKNLIKNHVKSKRVRGIIYINPYLDDNVVESLFPYIEDLEKVRDIVLLDDYNVPKLRYMYDLFEEIIYFPSTKKIRLIEATPIDQNRIDEYRRLRLENVKS